MTSENLTGKVDLICYDFDGVMTDNTVLVLQDGTEAVMVNRADGMAVSAMRKAGLRQMILSTEENPVVSARARKLNIQVLQGLTDKAKTLEQYCLENKITLDRVVFIGNDINDRDVMKIVGYPITPSDAYPAILPIARHVLKAKGGAGVVREFCETFFPGVL